MIFFSENFLKKKKVTRLSGALFCDNKETGFEGGFSGHVEGLDKIAVSVAVSPAQHQFIDDIDIESVSFLKPLFFDSTWEHQMVVLGCFGQQAVYF